MILKIGRGLSPKICFLCAFILTNKHDCWYETDAFGSLHFFSCSHTIYLRNELILQFEMLFCSISFDYLHDDK